MSFGSIYVVTNLLDGKAYVGQTILTPLERWRGHLKDAKGGRGYDLHQAIREVIREYGIEDVSRYFELAILGMYDSLNELNNAEKEWIIQMNTRVEGGWGYNLRGGGEGGGPAAASTKVRMSISQLKRPPDTPEIRLHKSQSQILRFKDPEMKRQQSQSQIRRFANPEARKALSEQTKRAMSDPKARERISLSLSNRPPDAPEVRLHKRDGQLRRWEDQEASREARLKAGQDSTQRWADPQFHAEQRMRIALGWTPEVKARASAAQRARRLREAQQRPQALRETSSSLDRNDDLSLPFSDRVQNQTVGYS
jgi:hypothetical protein